MFTRNSSNKRFGIKAFFIWLFGSKCQIKADVILKETEPDLDQHVFRVHVEVLAGVLLWIALPSTARPYCPPVIVKAWNKMETQARRD